MRAVVTDQLCSSCSRGFLIGDETGTCSDLYCNNCFKIVPLNPPPIILLLEEFDLEDTLDEYMDELFKGAD